MATKRKPSIEATENGPYIISGLEDLHSSRGDVLKSAATMVFCRCG
ncbi:MAG: hypothetical protein MUP70_02980 [Candidatus Aminicenantes bacterium]|nr:hypothetical protein [Candidatus Aminicenantes bacterium]